ncbi:MAG: enoyl-CoA hydratase-related protein, partial [Betaproteobacteria bacterium]|nr:enoyl-CoA hydratase-related protein [Betaproteobacteria bacterium]
MSIDVAIKDGIATVLMNRPDKLNALSAEMYHDLADQFVAFGHDDTVRAVVLTGAGRAFCAGGDVGTMANYDIV